MNRITFTLKLLYFCLVVYCCFCYFTVIHCQLQQQQPTINELKPDNIFTTNTVDCGDYMYYFINISKSQNIQDNKSDREIYLHYRWTRYYPMVDDVQGIQIFLKLNQVPTEQDYDAKSNYSTQELNMGKIPYDSVIYLLVKGTGMCRYKPTTTNNYAIEGSLSTKGFPTWAIVVVSVLLGSCVFVVLLSLCVVCCVGRKRSYTNLA
ncbi:hypothetical protein ABK040_001041 [Willaertia magna]